ncbi:MAG: DUF418 domain-containing protein [Flavobacterium sp.]|uniref:DUF418 domain-containing protein n=1 Tax=Flavobacterium sp. TaxID=239 RepID=UPI0032655E43
MDNPIAATSRSKILDILRGIALFGVFISNMGVFSGYVFMSSTQKTNLSTAASNVYYDFIHFAFIDGKFYSLFSLLFGVGFAVFMTKSKGILTFYKRLVILIGIGLAHALLIWEGDILLLYALLGLLLPLFSKMSNKIIVTLSIFLILSPILLDVARELSDKKFYPESFFFKRAGIADEAVGIKTDADFFTLVQKADYSGMRQLLVPGFYYRWGFLCESNRFPKVFALFLLGMMIGRNRWYENLEEKKPFLIRLRKWLFIIGFPTTLLFAYLNVFAEDVPKVIEATLYALSVIPMAFVYASTIVLIYIKNKTKLEVFSYVGKMTLTNYILQSCSAYLFFYGTGFALFGKTGSVFFPIFAIGVYSIQIILSKIWLQYFEFGPLEWIWRQLTYGKFIPIRKQS